MAFRKRQTNRVQMLCASIFIEAFFLHFSKMSEKSEDKSFSNNPLCAPAPQREKYFYISRRRREEGIMGEIVGFGSLEANSF